MPTLMGRTVYAAQVTMHAHAGSQFTFIGTQLLVPIGQPCRCAYKTHTLCIQGPEQECLHVDAQSPVRPAWAQTALHTGVCIGTPARIRPKRVLPNSTTTIIGYLSGHMIRSSWLQTMTRTGR